MFNTLVKNLKPDNVRFKTLQHQITKRINQEISCLRKIKKHCFFDLIEDNKKEINHLIRMKQHFSAADGDQQTLQTTVSTLLSEQKDPANRLFSPNYQSKKPTNS